MSDIQESLEWRSVVNAVLAVDLRAALPTLTDVGIIAYTDGACLKNPGGPAGWSALLWSATDEVQGSIRAGASCCESYGHIPKAKTTTNNRAEIAAVLAVLSIAPPTLPLKIYSDSEYTIKVAQGIYQMKANPDLWAAYRELLSYRKLPPTFEWVRGHAGQLHNERADELAGLGALNGDQVAYERWQSSSAAEAHNRPAAGKMSSRANAGAPAPSAAEASSLRLHTQNLKILIDAIDPASPRVSEQERKFVNDMAKRLQKNNFVPTEKQSNWLKGLAAKFHV